MESNLDFKNLSILFPNISGNAIRLSRIAYEVLCIQEKETNLCPGGLCGKVDILKEWVWEIYLVLD